MGNSGAVRASGVRWLGLGLAAVLSVAGDVGWWYGVPAATAAVDVGGGNVGTAAGTGSATAATAATAPAHAEPEGRCWSASAVDDPTTAAWPAALASEGVPYTEADATGGLGSETVTLPTLSSGTTGNFNGW